MKTKIDTKKNLCDTCKYEITTCQSNPIFGDGKGHDNIYECSKYE